MLDAVLDVDAVSAATAPGHPAPLKHALAGNELLLARGVRFCCAPIAGNGDARTDCLGSTACSQGCSAGVNGGACAVGTGLTVGAGVAC